MADHTETHRANAAQACTSPYPRWRVGVALVFCAMMIAGWFRAQAQDGSSEYQKKAQYIGKLAHYVEWPKDKMGHGIPLVIGIFGNDQASDQIREIIGSRRIKDREVVVKHLATVQEIAGCHILFVSRSEEARLAKILSQVRGDPILTVGESDTFLKKGGVINLRTAGGNVSMELNERNARRSSLVLSPMLADFQKGQGGG